MRGIPQADPKAEYIERRVEIEEAIRRVLERGRYILGPEVEAFEREFAQYIGVGHALGVASGTDALHLCLRALGIGSGDEVITVPHTAVATVAAIEQSGAMPVLVDIEPETYTLDPSRLEEAISPRTKGIVPVHLYGHPALLAEILEIARRYGIPVVEDCAQAHGAACEGNRVGSWGRLAAFSFYPTKNLGAFGDGGMVVTDDDGLAERVRLLREYGWRDRYVSEVSGFNSRLDELHAAVLRVKLRYLEHDNERRRALARAYSSALDGFAVLPWERPGCRHVYHLYVIRHPERDALRSFLASRGVHTGVHYPQPVHLQPAYRPLLPAQGGLPVSERLAQEIVSLPLYPQLPVEDVALVADLIREFGHAGRT